MSASTPLLELRDVTYAIEKDGEDLHLLDKITFKVPPRHFMAVVGPSGCGKSTLMKIITGLLLETDGTLFWQGDDLNEEGEIEPTELGYVPQFSIAYDHLTVEECVENALRLRVVTENADDFYDRADDVIAQVGMEEMRDKPVKVLSGGQRRRLGLAMELVSNPTLLLCDEVTSGLDPQSETDIVKLMHDLSRRGGRCVMNVTHSLANMDLYDSVLVLHEGKIVYHGPPDAVAHYFSVKSTEDIYPRLANRTSGGWQESWAKYRDDYYKLLEKRSRKPEPAKAGGEAESDPPAEETEHEPEDLPGGFSQFYTLLATRWRLFFRDRTQLYLQLALLIIFPMLVVIFAPGGLDAFPDEVVDPTLNYLEQAMQTAKTEEKQTKLGAMISGLVMFQVILLTLMGSNNSAREIAGERLIYEKMRLGGVRPASYLASKIVFLALLVLVQSSVMAMVVDFFCALPGSFSSKWQLLLLVNAAMTFICLAISSVMKSADQASLLSIYLVGFQLPLSGAILKLPNWLEPLTQPVIAAYWSWAGQMQGIGDAASPYYQGVQQAVATFPFPATSTCLLALLIHVIAGIGIAYAFCKRRVWE